MKISKELDLSPLSGVAIAVYRQGAYIEKAPGCILMQLTIYNYGIVISKDYSLHNINEFHQKHITLYSQPVTYTCI